MSGFIGATIGAISSSVSAAVDTFFNYVTLLLNGDGTNGQTNKIFLDSSSNTFTITPTGTPTQGTFSPFSQTGWSGYFNGTSSYVTAADTAVLDISTGDFTIEFYVNAPPSPVANNRAIARYNGAPTTGSSLQYGINFLTTGAVQFEFYNATLAVVQLTSATTALNNYSDAALTATKESLLAAIEGTANQPGVSPLYGLARKQHAELSGPVNQAKILNAMQETLTGEAGGERANAFLNAMGKGENALIKRADQSPRFGGLEDVLTEKQMAAANKVAGELTRDAKIADEARKGRVALTAILDNNKNKIRLPAFLSVKATVANETMSILEGKVNTKTIEVLKKAFESGKNVNELLDTLPAKDRFKFLAALGKAQSGLSPAKLTALGVTSNALAPTRIELNNMAPGRK